MQSWLLNFFSTFWWHFDLLLLKSRTPTLQYIIEVCKLLGPKRLGSLFSTYPWCVNHVQQYDLRTEHPQANNSVKTCLFQPALCLLKGKCLCEKSAWPWFASTSTYFYITFINWLSWILFKSLLVMFYVSLVFEKEFYGKKINKTKTNQPTKTPQKTKTNPKTTK